MKKLFSYLLISSMVVLSSCTNYDDQFDDLNSQINSLKSQIEGFSSLSSGLTALQGTVAALQSAVAQIPTTQVNISGLEASVAALQTSLASAATSDEAAAIQAQLTAAQAALASAIADNATASETNSDSIAALQTSLEAVTATLAELQTSLAAASTAAEVAALTTSLAAVQADLSDLLAQNNIYTPANAQPLKITTAAELTFAEGLGGKIGIINGDLTVTHAATMDATKLAAVLAKVKTVTGTVIYTATSTAITPTAGFTNLTSAGTLTVNANGDISFPKLASTGVLTLTDNTKTTSVSLPVLASVTKFKGASDHTINLTGATGFDAGALAHYPGNVTLSITTKGGLTNLDSLVSTKKDEPTVDEITKLVINGATELSIDKLAKGEIDADKITAAEFPLWQGHNSSVMPKATTVVLPSAKAYAGSATWNIKTMFPNATKFHIIAASSALTTTTTGTISVSVIDHADMETLILDGVLATVTVTGSTEVNDITLTGTAQTVNIQNTAVTEMDLGYTSGKIGVSNSKLYNGTLTIKDNEDMTSFTADKVDDVYSLTIQSNAKLETISMAALDSKGTTATGTVSHVQINGNALVASNFQLPSAVTVVPAVTGKITSASGLGSLQKYIDEVIKDPKSVSNVVYDKIEKYTTAAGAVHEVGGVGDLANAPDPVTYAGTSAATYKTVTPGAPGAAFTVVNVSPDTRSYDIVTERKQTNTVLLDAGSTLADNEIIRFQGSSAQDAVTVKNDATFRAGISNFVASDATTWAPAVAQQLSAALAAKGYAYTLTSSDNFGATAEYNVDVFSDASGAADSNGVSGSGLIEVTVGTYGTVSGTVGSGGAKADIATGIADAINNGALSNTFTATVVGASSDRIRLTKQLSAKNSSTDITFVDYPNLTFGTWSNDISTTVALIASQTYQQIGKVISKRTGFTAVNNSEIKQANLEAGAIFMTETTAGPLLSFTAIGDDGRFANTSSTLQVDWDERVAYSKTDDGTGSEANTVDNTVFL